MDTQGLPDTSFSDAARSDAGRRSQPCPSPLSRQMQAQRSRALCLLPCQMRAGAGESCPVSAGTLGRKFRGRGSGPGCATTPFLLLEVGTFNALVELLNMENRVSSSEGIMGKGAEGQSFWAEIQAVLRGLNGRMGLCSGPGKGMKSMLTQIPKTNEEPSAH